MTHEHQKQERTLHGTVVSDAGDKTVVVKVTRLVWHPKYHRQYHVSKRYAVHDEDNTAHVGDTVAFVASRPISKRKRWRLVKKVENAKSKM